MVTVHGAGFVSSLASTCKLGGISETRAVWLSSEAVSCFVGPGAPGPLKVQISNDGESFSSDAHRLASMTTWLSAMALTDLLTTIGKNFCGYLRPNYYGGCGFNETARACVHEFADGRHSFPSGHSSFSACAAVLLALSSMRAVDRLRQQGREGCSAHALRGLAVSSFCVAFYIAMSRVYDNYHFPADVITGSCLGYAVGAVGLRLGLPLQSAGAYSSASDDRRSTVPLLSGSARAGDTGPGSAI